MRVCFFNRVRCGNCHRLGDSGKAFTPDISNPGQRADPRVFAESILNPGAFITEGFHSLVVVTASGRNYTGFIKRESGDMGAICSMVGLFRAYEWPSDRTHGHVGPEKSADMVAQPRLWCSCGEFVSGRQTAQSSEKTRHQTGAASAIRRFGA